MGNYFRIVLKNDKITVKIEPYNIRRNSNIICLNIIKTMNEKIMISYGTHFAKN